MLNARSQIVASTNRGCGSYFLDFLLHNLAIPRKITTIYTRYFA